METDKKKIITDNDMNRIERLLRSYFKENKEQCNMYNNMAFVLSNKFADSRADIYSDTFDDIHNFLTCVINATSDISNNKEIDYPSFETLDEEAKQCLIRIMEHLKSIKNNDILSSYLEFFILFTDVKTLLSNNETNLLDKNNGRNVDSIPSFLSVLNEINSKKYAYYFRGQENSEWEPIASVFRSDYNGKEKQFYDDILKHCPREFDGLGHLDRLVKMQHYGLPTRLLDITSNPLVALYFACQPYSSEKNETDGAVFVFQPKEVKNAESDVGMMIAALACFSEEDQSMIAASSFNFFEDTSIYKDGSVERFFYEISKERPSFKRVIKPKDLHKNCFIQPKYTNERVKCQAGAFVMIGIDKDSLVKSKEKDDLAAKYKIIIPKENKENLLIELDKLAINRATVYQNLENVTKYIREKK